MSKKSSRYLLIVISLGVACIFPQVTFAQVEEYVSPETLLFEEVPVVYASAKREQLITETASSVEVITAEQIKQSGAVNIPDALRQIAGITVVEATPGTIDIGIRGYTYCSIHTLVTVDGNNVYIYHGNMIYYNAIPVPLAEIERIEILKGAGAIFYGASAFSGVINIVTKKPKDINGTQVDAMTGTHNTQSSSVIHGGSYEKWDYKVSGANRSASHWSGTADKDHDIDMFGASTTYNINDDSSVSFKLYNGDMESCHGGICDPENRYIALRYDGSDQWVRYFWNHHYKPCRGTPSGEPTYYDDNVHEIEMMRNLYWGNNITGIGGYYKYSTLASANLANYKKQYMENWALNIENETRFTDQLVFTLGGRYEHNSYLGALSSGRSSLLYIPVENHNLRFTVANGYYIPSFLQFWMEPWVYGIGSGNRELKEEGITSYELSYHGKLNERLKANVNIFHNNYKDMIKYCLTPAFITSVKNAYDAHQWGAEIGINFLFNDWLTGYANYTYNKTHRGDHGDLTIDPENMFNLGLSSRFLEKFTAVLNIHYVSKSYAYLTDFEGMPYAGLTTFDEYISVDPRIAYVPTDDVELALIVRNLFNDKHMECNGWGVVGDELDRRIMGSVICKF
ncbi:MAG: TonB-dependent receptor [Candidatus Omnitrophota bacterium]